MTSKRDYLEYSITQNKNPNHSSKEFLDRSGHYERFTNVYKDPSDSTYSPVPHRRDLNGSPLSHVKTIQIKPKLLEGGLLNNSSFMKLSPSFQKIFTSDEKD